MATTKVTAAARAASKIKPDDEVLRYEPLGNIREMFTDRSPEILLEGPAGTGKSLGALHKVNLCMLKYEGARSLCLRNTRVSIRQSLRVTWENTVRPHLNGVKYNKDDDEYRYPNGSIVALGGMDNPDKLLSSEWDMVYYQEALESTEQQIEVISTRLRYGVMPYQQLLMDVNPGPPKHFLNVRAENGYSHRLVTTHKDNPTLWSRHYKAWTERGKNYMARLEALHGVRYLRLCKGIWASAEGAVYEDWEQSKHLIPSFTPLPSMRCFWSVDFGYIHPFVAQLWVIDDDGTMVLFREIYRTQTLVEDHAKAMLKIERQYRLTPKDIVCDHDAENRATLEKHMGRETKPAHKAITEGIQAVQARLRIDKRTERPRLQIVNFPVEPDPNIIDVGKSAPTCTADEIEGYVWYIGNNIKKGEEPVGRDDHGMDCLRYAVAFVDGLGSLEMYPDYLMYGEAEGWNVA